MKKDYLTPRMETIELQVQQVIAGSLKATRHIDNTIGIEFASEGIADTDEDR